MSQKGDAESSSTDNPVFYTRHRHRGRLCQEDVVEASSGPGMMSEAQGPAPSRKRVRSGESRPGASLQAGDAAGASRAGLELQAVGPSPSQLPPGPEQGSAGCSKRLQVSLCDILSTRCLRNLCSTLLGLPKRALADMEGPAEVELASCPRPRGVGGQGMSALSDKGSSTLDKENFSERSLTPSPGPAPERARRKSRKSGSCPKGGQGANGFLWLDQSSGGDSQSLGGSLEGADLRSLGGPCGHLCHEDTRLGDPGGSQAGCAPGIAGFEYLPAAGSGAQPGSPLSSHRLCADESCSPATQDFWWYSALCLEGPGWPSAEQQEVERVEGAGSEEGLAAPRGRHGPEAQLAPRENLGQDLAVPSDTHACSPEPLGTLSFSPEATASEACTGPLAWRERGKCAEKLSGDPASCTREQPTDRSSDNSRQHKPEKASPEGCSRWEGEKKLHVLDSYEGVLELEEANMPCGVKHVCYVDSETGIQLQGAIHHSQAGEQQLPQLEALENFMEVSSASPSQKPRARKRPAGRAPTGGQGGPEEAVNGEPLPAVAEDSAQLQPGEETIAPDLDIRGTVVRVLWKALWSRSQKLSDLGLSEEAVKGIAADIEAALFDLMQGTTYRYKTKYRTLLFNLRDPRNPDLFLKVVHGNVTPHDLVRMSSVQLASQELARWRDQEEKKGLESIVQQQKEPCGLPVSKLTHKGEVEIPRDMDQMLILEDLGAVAFGDCGLQALPALLEKQHAHHFLDPDCHICAESLNELPGFSRASGNRGDSVFQRVPSTTPVSSPELPRARETPPMEPQDKCGLELGGDNPEGHQVSAGPTKTPPSPPPWEGTLDMFSIKRFRAKAQLVSGHSCRLIQALPEVIRSAGCISPSTVWDLLTSVSPAEAKDISVVRLCPQGTQDIHNCRLLYSYLNNKQCHGLTSVQHVGVVLLPLPAFQPLPPRLRLLGGPGLEITHSSLLLAVLLPKEGLPNTAVSRTVWRKVRKRVSFKEKVEIRVYQPEDRKTDVTLQQNQDKGSLSPRRVCAWPKFPRVKGKPWAESETQQCHDREKQSPKPGWCQPQHPCLAVPAANDFGYGQYDHRASCPYQVLVQNLKTLVTITCQLQASLIPSGQDPLLPSLTAFPQPPAAPGTYGLCCQSPTAAEIPDPAPNPSLGPTVGTKCPFPRKA
ncbi:SPOC domain-containing protein 1 isoform X3 [Cavia porcellus]